MHYIEPDIRFSKMITSKSIEFFYLLFEGIMIFQVLFFGMVYFISRRKDVLYYSLLNLVSALYFFLNAPDTFLGIDPNIVFNSPAYLYVNFALFLSMFFTYVIFLKEVFNDTVEQYGYVKKTYIMTSYVIPLFYLLFVLFGILGLNTQIIFYSAHLINGPFCTMILILNIREKGYKKLIISGLLVIFVCLILTIAFTIRYNEGDDVTLLDRYPLALIKLGMLIDIILFQLALLKRWNGQEKQLATEKMQSQLELERLRNKISGELHDDIGSTLSGISMYSYLIKSQLKNEQPLEVEKSLNIMQQSATQMVNRLNDIVWFVNPEEDSIGKIIQRLEEYATDMGALKNMQVKVAMPAKFSVQRLEVESRRNIYLFCKEAINNAIKYSEADLLQLAVKENSNSLEISISDNGKGFDTGTVKKGNGLVNMQKRAAEIKAGFTIQSGEGAGCSISLIVKITQ